MRCGYKEYWGFNGSEDAALYLVGANAGWEAVHQPLFMKGEVGLKPHHRFLDLGCGCLRGTLGLVDYLEDGNFWGADISEGLIEKARERAKGCRNRANLRVVNGFDYRNEIGGKFDIILSVSLVTHILEPDLQPLMEGVRGILKDGGEWYFSVIPFPEDAENNTSGNIAAVAQKLSFLKEVGKKAGLEIEEMEGDYPNPVPGYKVVRRVNQRHIGQWMMVGSPCNDLHLPKRGEDG